MSRWQISDAALVRVEKRVAAAIKADVDSTMRSVRRPWETLLEAVKPEDFARPRSAAEGVVKRWIQEGKMLWFCSSCFEIRCREREELREAGNDLMNGIRAMGRLKL